MMSDAHPIPNSLQANLGDHVATLLRATLGNIPGGGALVTELINVIIPNQRTERFAAYVAKLAFRLHQTESELGDLKETLRAEKTALFEDGAQGAVRATSEARIDQLVELVSVGLLGADREAEDQRSIVRLLNDLSDADLRYLMLWTERYGHDREWRAANGYDWRWARDEDDRDVAVGDSPIDNLVELSTQARLVGLGLLEKYAAPEGTGSVTAAVGGYELETAMSQAGLDLLRRMGLLEQGEA